MNSRKIDTQITGKLSVMIISNNVLNRVRDNNNISIYRWSIDGYIDVRIDRLELVFTVDI